MAVYTAVSAAQLEALLARYDVGTLLSAKGIAEGVENSNYLLDTTQARFILTLYEKRVDVTELPYFLALLDHLADRGLPVPRAIVDRSGAQVQTVAGRPACLIEFLSGVSVMEPTPAQCHAAAAALGKLHAATADFRPVRANRMALPDWRTLADACRERADEIAPELPSIIAEELAFLEAYWPRHLERSTIHADLFPDNVLMLGDAVTGLIDFYFACTDLRAYDLAVMHSAWCFSGDGTTYFPDRGQALGDGYRAGYGALPDDDVEWFGVLCRGACLRFVLSRTYDWLNTPADALVTRKDPIAFAARLRTYRDLAGSQALGLTERTS